MDCGIALFCIFLYCHFWSTYLPQKGFCTGRYSMGRCICKLNGIYSDVAYGAKKSRKLVLVDRNEHCFHPTLFY